MSGSSTVINEGSPSKAAPRRRRVCGRCPDDEDHGLGDEEVVATVTRSASRATGEPERVDELPGGTRRKIAATGTAGT